MREIFRRALLRYIDDDISHFIIKQFPKSLPIMLRILPYFDGASRWAQYIASYRAADD